MNTFLSGLLESIGLRRRTRPAIEEDLVAAVTPPARGPLDDLPPAPPRRRARRVVVARPPSLDEVMRKRLEELGDSLIGGSARLDAIYNSVSRLGGPSDKGATALPDTSRVPLGLEHLDVLYRFSAYGRRVVDIVADEETRKGWKVTDGTQSVDALAEEEKRLQLSARINQARKWARHAGGSAILLVVDEEIPAGLRRASDVLRLPLDPARVRRLRNLVVLDRMECSPVSWDGDITSPTFGEVSAWSISPGTTGVLSSGGQALSSGSVVHASRLLTFSGRRLPRRLRTANGGWDDSVLEPCWDAIRHLTSIDQGAALLAQEWAIKVLKIKGLAGIQTSDQATAFYTRLQQMATSMSLLNMSILDEQEDLTSLNANVTGFEELSAHARTELAAAADMPQVLLFGEAPAGLNTDGESWRKHHAQSIAASQETELRPPLERVYRLIYAQSQGPTRGQVPEKWDLEFLPLEEMSEAERAEVRKMYTEIDAVNIDRGVYTPEHVARSRYGQDGWSDEILPVDPAEETEAAAQAALDRARAILDGGNTPARTDADEYVIPEGAQGNARRVLRWRDEHPDEIQGMTETGWARARQLARGGTISGGDLVEIAAWFARHGAQAGTKAVAAEYAGQPWRDAGYVSWLGWGGDTMASYAKRARAAMDRVDAESAAWVSLPVPDAMIPAIDQLRATVEAITGPLEVRGRPHVTLLYAGPMEAEGLAELVEATDEAVEEVRPLTLRPVGLSALVDEEAEPGAPMPVVLEVEAWDLARIAGDLLRRSAHLVTARQHGAYVPHVTLGWTPTLTDDQRGRIGEVTISREQAWTAARVEVCIGETVIRTFPLEGRTDAEDAA